MELSWSLHTWVDIIMAKAEVLLWLVHFKAFENVFNTFYLQFQMAAVWLELRRTVLTAAM